VLPSCKDTVPVFRIWLKLIMVARLHPEVDWDIARIDPLSFWIHLNVADITFTVYFNV
jgi:hypothetical protein